MTVNLEPPFFASDGGDVDIFMTMEELAADVGVYDLKTLEFFDANGRRLLGTADGFQVSLAADPSAPPDPERLEKALRGFFARLPSELAEYSSAAERATNLAALVAVREELERRPRAGRTPFLVASSHGSLSSRLVSEPLASAASVVVVVCEGFFGRISGRWLRPPAAGRRRRASGAARRPDARASPPVQARIDGPARPTRAGPAGEGPAEGDPANRPAAGTRRAPTPRP